MAKGIIAVRHTVGDYDKWRPVYESVESLRQQYGCSAKSVWSDPANKNDLLVIHEFPGVTEAQGFAGDPALKDAMERSGVAGAPRIEIYESRD